MRARLVLALMSVLGCAVDALQPPRQQASPDAPPAAVPSTPDEILQAGLREAVRNLDATMATLAPVYVNMVGLLNAGGAESVVTGRLDPAEVQQVVRERFGAVRLCYEEGLARNRGLRGRVTVKFEIAAPGNEPGS